MRSWCLRAILISVAIGSYRNPSAHADVSTAEIISIDDEVQTRKLPMVRGKVYSVAVSLAALESLTGNEAIEVEIGKTQKRLYWGDQNLFMVYSPYQQET